MNQTAYPEWDDLASADPDHFLLPAESDLIDPSLFWWYHDLKKAGRCPFCIDEIVTYAGSGIIKVTEKKTNILFVYIAQNGESHFGSDWMLEAAKHNLKKLLDGKIKFGFEKLAAEEIRNQLKFVSSEEHGKPVTRLLEKWEKKNGIVKLAKPPAEVGAA